MFGPLDLPVKMFKTWRLRRSRHLQETFMSIQTCTLAATESNTWRTHWNTAANSCLCLLFIIGSFKCHGCINNKNNVSATTKKVLASTAAIFLRWFRAKQSSRGSGVFLPRASWQRRWEAEHMVSSWNSLNHYEGLKVKHSLLNVQMCKPAGATSLALKSHSIFVWMFLLSCFICFIIFYHLNQSGFLCCQRYNESDNCVRVLTLVYHASTWNDRDAFSTLYLTTQGKYYNECAVY